MIFLIFHIEKHIVVASIPGIFLFKKLYLTCQIHDFNVFLVYFFSLHFFFGKNFIFLFFCNLFFYFSSLHLFFLKNYSTQTTKMVSCSRLSIPFRSIRNGRKIPYQFKKRNKFHLILNLSPFRIFRLNSARNVPVPFHMFRSALEKPLNQIELN